MVTDDAKFQNHSQGHKRPPHFFKFPCIDIERLFGTVEIVKCILTREGGTPS